VAPYAEYFRIVASANLDLVRSIISAWERGDFSPAKWTHPELEFVIADGPQPGSWTGAVPDGFRTWVDAWEEFRTEADEYRELDDERVFVLTRFSGRGKTSGLDLDELLAKAAHVFHIRDGKVMKVTVYFDRQRAFADLGLPSEAGSQDS
jgi:ketosteroid isomerase-like protein